MNNIDWELLRSQKEELLKVIEYRTVTDFQVEMLSGILHLLDAVQDTFEPVSNSTH